MPKDPKKKDDTGRNNLVNLENRRQFEKNFRAEMREFQQDYIKFCQRTNDKSNVPEDLYALFSEWALYYHELCEEDLHFVAYDRDFKIERKNLSKAPSKDKLMKHFFPKCLRSVWPIRFTNKFLRKLRDTKNEETKLKILEAMQLRADGMLYSCNVKPIDITTPPYMAFFKSELPSSELDVLLCIHVERLPVFDKNEQIKSWEFIHVMRFLDIIGAIEPGAKTCLDFRDEFARDPARNMTNITPRTTKMDNYSLNHHAPTSYFTREMSFENIITHNGSILRSVASDTNKRSDEISVYPVTFDKSYLDSYESSELEYFTDIKRYAERSQYNQYLKRQEDDHVAYENSQKLNALADFASTAGLVNLLEKIKSLKLKLTKEEKELIGQDGNVLAIGRSGTGKTTCCILRLLAQNMLYKIRVFQGTYKGNVQLAVKSIMENFTQKFLEKPYSCSILEYAKIMGENNFE